MGNNTKIKFKKDNQEQIDLGVSVLVNAYNSKCKCMIRAIEKALKQLDSRDAAKLPRPDSLVGTLGKLKRAMAEHKRPDDDDAIVRGCNIVIQGAYDKLTENQVSMNDIKKEPAEDVKVPDVCPQEDKMEQDAEEARKDLLIEGVNTSDTDVSTMVAFRIVEVADRAITALLSMINQGGSKNV